MILSNSVSAGTESPGSNAAVQRVTYVVENRQLRGGRVGRICPARNPGLGGVLGAQDAHHDEVFLAVRVEFSFAANPFPAEAAGQVGGEGTAISGQRLQLDVRAGRAALAPRLRAASLLCPLCRNPVLGHSGQPVMIGASFGQIAPISGLWRK